MKIFITGVAGFIGSNLAKALVDRGHQVSGIDNLSYGRLENISALNGNPSFTFIHGDVANPFIYAPVEADVIVHLASQKIPRYNNALRTLDENMVMLKNVVAKCVRDNSKLVFASTSDVYGKNPAVPFHEESDLVMGPTTVRRWAYALSKIYGEQYIIACSEEYNLRYSITRFFGSYGPNQNLTWWGGPQSVFITKAFNKEPIEIHGDGSQTRTFTYVNDTVGAIVLCVEKEEANNEIFNTGSDVSEETTIANLARRIWRLINGPDAEPLLNFIPYSTFGKYEDVMRRVPDISKLKSRLGFVPQYTLETGLIETIKWQKAFMGL